MKIESRSRVSIALPGGFVPQVHLCLVALSLACTQTLSHLQPCTEFDPELAGRVLLMTGGGARRRMKGRGKDLAVV